MELELGLSLSNCSRNPNKIIPSLKELDLISYVNCAGKGDFCDYDDNLSGLSCQSSVNDGDYDDQEVRNYYEKKKKKRKFDEVEVESSGNFLPKTLPLLNWDDQPNEDDKEIKKLCKSSSFNITKNESDEVVGWPPIKTYRKKQTDAQHQHQQQHRGRRGGNFAVAEHGGGGCCGSRSTYVKVQMEGCFITRKIDLKLYNSYESLTSTLLQRFGKDQNSMDDYELTYQDGDGDWLLAGDVPWRTFIRSVQRLKMMRRDD